MKNVFAMSLIPLLAIWGLALAAQSGPFLVSTRETSKDVYVRVNEDSAGTRELQVLVPAGRNIDRKPEIVHSEDVSARAFDADGKEMGLTVGANPGGNDEKGQTLIAVCNAGSCNAIKIYHFSVPKAETNRVRKVIVVYRKQQYELLMEKYPAPSQEQR